MNPADLEATTTLAPLLSAASREVMARHLPSQPWLRQVDQVIGRVISLARMANRHFVRQPAADIPPTAPFGGTADRSEPDFLTGAPLRPDLRAALADALGAEPAGLRVHIDEHAEHLARGQRADAVTVGRNVFFRKRRFEPDTEHGFALLVHEAAHVLASIRPGADWRRATGAGRQQEEAEARWHEERALQRRSPAPVRPPTSARLAADSNVLAADALIRTGARVPRAHPMAAATDRTLEARPSNPAALGPATSTLPDLASLRADLYRDLMRQLRADFERGA